MSVRSLSCVALLMVCAACGSGKKDEEKADPAKSQDSAPGLALVDQVQGFWQTDCQTKITTETAADGTQTQSTETTSERLTIQDHTMLIAQKTYEDQRCHNPHVQFEIVTTFAIGAPIEAWNSNEMDLIVQKTIMTPLSDSMTKHLNATSACGLTNWEKDKGVEVTGLKDCFYEKDEKIYTSIRMQKLKLEISDDEDNNGESPATRQITFSGWSHYTKLN